MEKNANSTVAKSATPTVKDLKSVNLSQLQHVSARALASNGRRGGNGSLSLNVVFSENNGKRIKLSNALHAGLGSPTQVQVAQDGKYLIIGATLPGAEEVFEFPTGKGTTILYNAALVKWVIDAFNLDYSNCVSRSYNKVRFDSQEVNGSKITFAIIEMN